ncbi:hypothetical protein [Alteromonas macleodii]|uniref:Uncharacterized protein n=1 Tax=Alteromonas macleodii TaxID=28108 RepID=A0A6T9Y076_ALTMA|nr:hypothetical protein [Alteromonas macleodii]CAB9494432.1 protein of unknown function [Alteromonas macleodii]
MNFKLSKSILYFAFAYISTFSFEVKSDETDKANGIPLKLTSENYLELSKSIDLSDPIIGKAYEALLAIIQDKNTDADIVWEGVKSLQLLFSNLNYSVDITNVAPNCKLSGNDKKTDLNCLVKKVDILSDQLREASYKDQLHFNGNLSHQTRTRFKSLLTDATLVARKLTTNEDKNYKYTANSFVEELSLFSKKYINSARFIGGVGLSYSYIPVVDYKIRESLDISHLNFFSTTLEENTFSGSFSHKGFPSLSAIGKTPYFTISARFPFLDIENSFLTPVKVASSNDASSFFYQTSVESKMSVNYEISIETSISRILSDMFNFELNSNQSDWTLGVGFTGIDWDSTTNYTIKEFSSTETTSFSQGEVLDTITLNTQKSYVIPHYSLNFHYILADSLTCGFSAKYHLKKDKPDSSIDVNGMTVGFEIRYYPTF